jgi:hypothetical protein
MSGAQALEIDASLLTNSMLFWMTGLENADRKLYGCNQSWIQPLGHPDSALALKNSFSRTSDRWPA